MNGFVVDDNADRAEMFVEEVLTRSLGAFWLRPTPKIGSPGSCEQHIDNRDALEEVVAKNEDNPGIWFWDVGLVFTGDRPLTFEDYKVGEFAFSLLKRLLDKGHVVVLTSSNAATSVVKKILVASGVPDAHVREYAEDFDSLSTEKGGEARKDFCRRLVEDGIASLLNSLMAAINSFPVNHFSQDQSVIGILPHTWPTNEDQQTVVNLLRDIVVKLTGANACLIDGLLKRSAHGIFESIKTLIGHSARVHSGQGYPPCLGILPLLLVRALSRSGKWKDVEIAALFSSIRWTPKIRNISLCSNLQQPELIREWLREIGDTLLPILALRHDRSNQSDLSRIELNEEGRFFRLTFSSRWEGLLPKMHSESIGAGSTYGAWLRANRKFAICGPGVGWDTSCTVNVYCENGETIWDFRVNRESV